MLEAARAARAAGIDLVIGYIESHGRLETERLATGIEQLPLLEAEYRGIVRAEFDLDAALARHPAIVVVDEMAHSNLVDGRPKQRHAKRWQDIEELVAAGIGVWTTVNVQHLEGLNDVVAGITGVRQRETISDRIFDQADDVVLIDLPPRDLLARLQAGKVYSVEHASPATKRYFREPNLLALRELAVALIIATLGASVAAQTRAAGKRERRTALLYAMSRELVSTRSLEDLARVAVKHVAETFASRAVVLVPDANGHLLYPKSAPTVGSLLGADLSIAQWVYDKGTPAGLGTDTLPAAAAQCLPLRGSQHVLGVLAVEPMQRRRLLLPEQRHLIETFAAQIALALERARLQEAAEQSRVTAETDGLRNTLLASISHDLRTPLAVIAGASSALSDASMNFDPQARRSLAAQIEAKSNEMAAIISNVLDLMRLENGHFSLRLDWVMLEDLVNSALQRLSTRLLEHAVEVQIPTDLPPVHVDSSLVLQVFTNLLENVVRHTPAGTHVFVSAAAEGTFLRVNLDDTGPGLPPGDLERLFAKFHRGRDESSAGGAGLGLSICRAILTAHGGQIDANQRSAGGARFSFTLPVS
jgi:K+-sensing histidine kinase KdpD